MKTYYAHELVAGMTQSIKGSAHEITKVTTLALCNNVKEVVVQYAPCGCHTGPSNSIGYSPIDLVSVETPVSA